MRLKEILQQIVDEELPVLLHDNNQDWEAGVLLGKLSERVLSRPAYMQTGMYIAEINEKGYLGTVLYRLKQKN